ncbi:MAG: hypothetical protein FJ147_09470 [Deltaproteobacteria bacterium]|nr:hypothetical protein [Deltaproteobacteria bacterium]
MIIVLLTHVAATWTMVGLIWFVQIVHYPLFAQVGADQFTAYETTHNRLTTWVVGPPMLIEVVTAFLLVLVKPEQIPASYVWGGVLLVAIIWGSTALLQVPQHEILTRGFAADVHRFLLTSNWIRTIAWTLRGVLALMMLDCLLRPQ